MPALPTVSQSPTDPAFVQDPYPFYDRLRALGPLVYWQDYDLVVAAGYGEVSALLRDRRLGREQPDPEPAPPHLAPFYAIEDHSMLEAEGARHKRLRGLVARAFTSRNVRTMAPMIEALCHGLIDRFPGGEVDLLQTYCAPVPVVVIARLLGVPETMAPDLLRWSHAMVAMYQARRTHREEVAAADASTAFAAFLRAHIDARRAHPEADLITDLIAAEAEGERLSTEELIATCVLILNAGHEATVHTLGNGIAALISQGAPHAWLERDCIEATAEEVLRFDAPLHMFTRYAYGPTEIYGHHLARGDQVGLLLGAANRDPRAFAEPNRFDPFRPRKLNASFGAGLHFCIGAGLARLEIQIALRVLFERLPGLRLSAPPHYANLYHFHGLESLMVTSEPLSTARRGMQGR